MRFAFWVLLLFAVLSCASPPSSTGHPPATSRVGAGFEVSAEKKQTSLVAIKALVDRLNAIIARKSFVEWQTYLDDEYLATYGDPARLKEYSANSPFLKQFNVKLKSLEDYFKFVVVPSRANVMVDDITFVDENRVNVWTVVDNERVLLYLLKVYGKQWKISSW